MAVKQMLFGTAGTYTFLQISPPDSIQHAKQLALAALISGGAQLLIKLGEKLIGKIGQNRRNRKKKEPQVSVPS